LIIIFIIVDLDKVFPVDITVIPVDGDIFNFEILVFLPASRFLLLRLRNIANPI
jgi:hypothetical protein